MKNVEMTVEGTTLTIKVDLSKEFGPSASGKTTIIASTEGNVTIPNREEKVGLNVYRKNDLGWIHGLRDIEAPQHNHRRARLVADARRWISRTALRPEWPKQRLY